MEEANLIYLTLDDYQEWSQIVIQYLSQHSALPYARALLYDNDTCSILCQALFLHMVDSVMDSLDDLKSNFLYDIWIHLWEMYGDPHIPPFIKDLIPLVAADSSSDEITPPAPISPIDPALATNASDSV